MRRCDSSTWTDPSSVDSPVTPHRLKRPSSSMAVDCEACSSSPSDRVSPILQAITTMYAGIHSRSSPHDLHDPVRIETHTYYNVPCLMADSNNTVVCRACGTTRQHIHDRLHECQQCGAMFASQTYVSDERSKNCAAADDPTVRGDSINARLNAQVSSRANALAAVLRARIESGSSVARGGNDGRRPQQSAMARVERDALLSLTADALGGQGSEELVRKNVSVFQRILKLVDTLEVSPEAADALSEASVSLANDVFLGFAKHRKGSCCGATSRSPTACRFNVQCLTADAIAISCLLEACERSGDEGGCLSATARSIHGRVRGLAVDSSGGTAHSEPNALPVRVQHALRCVRHLANANARELAKSCVDDVDDATLSSEDVEGVFAALRSQLTTVEIRAEHGRLPVRRAFEWMDSNDARLALRKLPATSIQHAADSTEGRLLLAHALCRAMAGGASPIPHDEVAARLCKAAAHQGTASFTT